MQLVSSIIKTWEYLQTRDGLVYLRQGENNVRKHSKKFELVRGAVQNVFIIAC